MPPKTAKQTATGSSIKPPHMTAQHLPYQQIAEAIPAMVIVYNIQTGDFVYANQAITKLLGYQPADFLTGGMSFVLSLVHPDDSDMIATQNAAALALANQRQVVDSAEELVVEFEYRMRHKDGSWRWLHTDASVLSRDAQGQVEVVLNASLDITERKRVELELQQLRQDLEQQIAERQIAAATAERRATNILESISDGFVAHDRQGNYQYVNQRAAELLGKNREEFSGQNVWQLFPKLADSEIRTKVEQAIEQQQPEVFEYMSPQIQRWMRAQIYPTREGVALYFTDIHDQRQAQQLLKQSEARYRALIENSTDGTVLSDKDWQYTYVSPSIQRMLGYSPKHFLKLNVGDNLHPDDLAQHRPEIELMRATPGMTITNRVRAKHKDGSWRWLEVTATNLLEDPAVHAVVSNFRDVTDEIVAQEALQLAKDQLELTFKNVPNGIAIFNPDQEILFANLKGAQHLGFDSVEAMTRHGDIPRIRHQYLERFQVRDEHGTPFTSDQSPVTRVLNGELEAEYAGQFIDLQTGEETWVLARATPVLDAEDRITMVLYSITDITAQKQAHLQLTASEERLALAMASSELGTWDWDVTTDTLVWSDQLHRLFGLEPGDLTGGYDQYIQLIHPEDRQPLQQAVSQAMKTGEMYKIEHRVIHPDGSIHWLQGMGQATKNSQQQVIRMSGTTMNIDERKELQQRKDEFLGIASHELKTPVTSLKAYTQIIERQLAKEGNTKLVRHLHKMDLQLDKLTDLINDLLDVTKIESGKLVLQPVTFDLDELVEEVVETMQLTTDQHQIHRTGKAQRHVHADRERIGQVLTNFLSNAIKYSPESDKILVAITTTAKSVTVKVQDFGVGINPVDQPQVFDRFYRASGEMSQTFPGLGLGLYICAEIIKRHHGKIWVTSQLGHGSTFGFSLTTT